VQLLGDLLVRYELLLKNVDELLVTSVPVPGSCSGVPQMPLVWLTTCDPPATTQLPADGHDSGPVANPGQVTAVPKLPPGPLATNGGPGKYDSQLLDPATAQ
jgi:hypothetical protein